MLNFDNAGLYSEVLVVKDAFTENEEFSSIVGLMSAVIIYRGVEAQGLENMSILYFSENLQ
jgi:hypothetical protein